MKQPLGESLSALMDQEAGELDLQRVLNELAEEGADPGSNGVLVKRWRRYNLVSAAMRNDLGPFAGVDLSERIAEQLQRDAVELPSSRARLQRWVPLLKPVVSVAAAASVTAVILTGAQFYQAFSGQGGVSPGTMSVAGDSDVSAALAVSRSVGFPDASPILQASALAGSELVEQGMVPAGHRGVIGAESDYGQADILARDKLDIYLQHHLENAALNTAGGLMPLARTVSDRSDP